MKLLNSIAIIILLGCVRIWAVKWQLRRPTNSVTIRQNAGAICDNKDFGEFVESPNDCRRFYLCVDNGEAVEASCPPNMLFNVETKLCDLASKVQCAVTTVPTIATSTTGSENSNGDSDIVTDAGAYCAQLEPQQGKNRIVYIGSSTKCNQYYICYYGQAILQECAVNLHWNANTGKCDLPERAQCTLEETQTSLPPTAVSDSSTNHAGSDTVSTEGYPTNGPIGSIDLIDCPVYGQHLYPHMQRCEFFVYCVKGQAILQQCPFYYHFDIITKSCQFLPRAVCVRSLSLKQRRFITKQLPKMALP